MGEISVKTGNNARNGGKNSLNRLIRCVCGKKIGPDPRNFNQRVSLGRNDLLIRTFPRSRAVAEQLNAGVLLEGMRKLELMSPEHFSICNGHDFTCILKMMYETDISVNRNMRLDEIDNYLRLCYDQPTFKTTRLHTSLNQLLALH
ncbi:hypothetical protein [Klebsiella pneumoniae]|nr:hypothetical protein [Klebsiella pneumoniae]